MTVRLPAAVALVAALMVGAVRLVERSVGVACCWSDRSHEHVADPLASPARPVVPWETP